MIRYSLRSLFARPGATLAILMSVAVMLGGSVALLAAFEGLFRMFDATGAADNVVVEEKGVLEETDSTLPTSYLGVIKAASGIKQGPAGALVSPEIVYFSRCRPVEGGGLVVISTRAVDPVAAEVHSTVKLLRGRWPNPGEPGILLGKRVVGTVENAEIGKTMRLIKGRWPVLGVFEAPDTAFESEIWTDRVSSAAEFRDPGITIVTVRLQDPASIGEFTSTLQQDRSKPTEVLPERAFYARRTAALRRYAIVAMMMTLLLSAGVVLGCANTMYSMFTARQGEIATLLAIGFTRRQVMRMLAQETILLCSLGLAMAVTLGLLVHGHAVDFRGFGVIFSICTSSRVLGVVGALALLIALGITAATVVRTSRLDIRQTLRTG